ncbi:unnamed protein product [Paramecium sonneborni]|uniref:C2 domain-containing protein n=1 Tax=Paramecium sonneborni TaxID=65129 RepID=A0A8S1NTR6_9CILI|nr:unnamed protein product [Paramecium sonneborni]
MNIDEQKCILRIQLIAGHQMLLDKDQQRCFIEFKLDGESKQSYEKMKSDDFFDQVFHFHINQNKNANRELQVLLCNINRGGYMSKQTLGKINLRQFPFQLNHSFDRDISNTIKDKLVTIQVALSFINNLFVDNVTGEVIVNLLSIIPQNKGILAMSLGGSQTTYTFQAGTELKIINDSPYCKLTLIYYYDVTPKEYFGINQIKLLKQQSLKKDIFLCDLNWKQKNNELEAFLEKIQINAGMFRIKVTLSRKQEIPKIVEEKQIVPQKKVMAFKSIKIEGFPTKELGNAKYYLQIRTPNYFYFTHLSVIPQWDCDFALYEQNYTIILYNYLGDKKTSYLAKFENSNEGELSLPFQQFLKTFYGSNPNQFQKVTQYLNLQIRCDITDYTSPIVDNPRGIINLPITEFSINEYQGNFMMFQTQSIYDYVQVRKYKANRAEIAFDIPLYEIKNSICFGGQQIPIKYDSDDQNKEQVLEEKLEKSNFVKITVHSVKITKNENLQVTINAEDLSFQTSKICGIYFGQSFICKFPNKLSIQLINRTENDIIQDTFTSFIDLQQLDFLGTESFVNIQMNSVNKQCLLTIRLEMSGHIAQVNRLSIIPQALYPISTEGTYYMRVLFSYRFYYDYQQVKSEKDYLIFDKFEWTAEDLWKPIRFQLFYQSGNKKENHTLLADHQLQAIDLLWKNKKYVIRDKCRFEIKKEQKHGLDVPQKIIKGLDQPKIFVKFTPLSVQFQQNSQDLEQVEGFAMQLHHITKDTIARLKDNLDFEYNEGLMEQDRTENCVLKYPVSTQLSKLQIDISMIKLINQELRINQFVVPIDVKQLDSIQYVETRSDIPMILKFRRQIIQHMKLSHKSLYDVSITNIGIINQGLTNFKFYVGKTNLIKYPWIKDGVLQQTFKESVQPILFQLDEIDTNLEFVLFTDVMIYRRHVINISTIQFIYNDEQQVGTYDLIQEEFKCQIIIKESSEEFKAGYPINISFNTMTKLKNMAGRFFKYRFSYNFESKLFSNQLKYTFYTSINSYVSFILQRSEGQLEGEYEYTIIIPERKKFPRNHSVAKIFLGSKELYLVRHQETRGEDMETILETKIKIRNIYVLSIEPTQSFTCVTKEGKIIELDEQYLVYKQIKTQFTIGKFEIMIYRLLKDIEKNYSNKYIGPDLRLCLKYNKQKYWITGINDQGLMMDGEFQKCEFYVSNVTDLLKIQLFIHDYLVAENEYCVPLLKEQFIQELQRVMYRSNDLIYHFHQKLKLKNIWVMGRCKFQKQNWVKIFFKFLKLKINQDQDEEKQLRSYSLKVSNNQLDWISKVYSTSRNSTEIDFQDEEIVDQIISPGEEDQAFFKLDIRMNGDIIAEKLLVLKPFIARNVNNFPFEFKINDKISLTSAIEVSQKFKSENFKKQIVQEQKFDFRKTSYEDLIISMLNFQGRFDKIFQEIFEFLTYNLPNKYEPDKLFKVCKAIFCIHNTNLTLVCISTQCMSTIFLSHSKQLMGQISHLLLLQQIQDLVTAKNKAFKPLINIPYYDEYLPTSINTIKNLQMNEGELLAYLKANFHKVKEDLFQESRDKHSAKITYSCIKILDTLLQNNSSSGLEVLKYLPILIEAYQQFDDYENKIGNIFTILTNTLIQIYLSQEHVQEIINIVNSNFVLLLQVFFETIEKASQQQFIAILLTMHHIIKIVNQDQLQFLKLVLKYLIRSLIVQKDLELHIGVAIEYFQPNYQQILKQVLSEVSLEKIALEIIQQEFQNIKQSNVLSNLFDMIIQSIELGIEHPYLKLQEYIKQAQPKHESNKIKVEKFMTFMSKRAEREEKLKLLKEKKTQTQTIDEQKKRLMDRFMISKLPW